MGVLGLGWVWFVVVYLWVGVEDLGFACWMGCVLWVWVVWGFWVGIGGLRLGFYLCV